MSSSLPIPSSLTRSELLATSFGGALVFPAVLGLGQLAVFKPLRLTHSSPLASVCGCVSVLVAGYVASTTAVKVLSLSSRRWHKISPSPGSSRGTVEFGVQELMASTVASAILFRAFSGRFSSVLPSHLLKPGAFAREWIPSGSTQATEKQRHIIHELGKSHGCHSCGTRGVKKFHADHQPPTKIHNNSPDSGITQRLYPQCRRCSSLQGALLSQGNGSQSRWSAIRTHPLSLRAFHLFLPIPLAIAYLKSGSTTAMQSNRNIISSIVVEEKQITSKATQTAADVQTAQSSTLHSLLTESNLPGLIRDFPLLIIWNRIVYFLDSFHNPGDAFHITLLAFAVVAALGTV